MVVQTFSCINIASEFTFDYLFTLTSTETYTVNRQYLGPNEYQ